MLSQRRRDRGGRGRARAPSAPTQRRARPGDGRDLAATGCSRRTRSTRCAASSIPRALVVTPNLPEAAALLDDADRRRPKPPMRGQAERLLALGAARRADQGRPRRRRARASTCWSTPTASRASPRRASRPATRTAPAARCRPAIAAGLAKGRSPCARRVRDGKAYVSAAIAAADTLRIGRGPRPRASSSMAWLARELGSHHDHAAREPRSRGASRRRRSRRRRSRARRSGCAGAW